MTPFSMALVAGRSRRGQLARDGRRFGALADTCAVAVEGSGALARSLIGAGRVDQWGLDPDVFDAWAAATLLRYEIGVEGGERLPDGPILVVANRRVGLAEPSVLAAGLHAATGRRLRLAGLVDVPVVSTLGRRAGVVLADADEIAPVLRGGASVAVFARRQLRVRARIGVVPAGLVGPAVTSGIPVVPVALVGHELGRGWTVRVGVPLAPPPYHGRLAVAEHTQRVRGAVQALLG